MRRCLQCPTLIFSGSRCPTHKAQHRGGSGHQWEKMRQLILARDGGCVLPPPHDYLGVAPRIDHIDPNGPSVPANLRTLCLLHHRRQPSTSGGG